MKTRAEFLAAVKAYRSKSKIYIFIWPLVVLAGFAWPILLIEILRHFYVIPKNFLKGHSPGSFLLLLLWLGSMSGMVFLVTQYFKRMAISCGLVCPECSRIADPTDIKLITASHNCPYCGGTFFE